MNPVVAMTVSSYSHRIDYFRTTLASWRHVRGLDRWRMRFHVEPGEALGQCVQGINDYMEDLNFDIVLNTQRLGVLVNPWSSFNSAFELGSDLCLLVEEDLIVSPDILEYAEHCHDKYSSDPKVLGFCCTCFHEFGDRSVTYTAQDFCPLGWGTWHDRWYDVLRDTWDKNYSTGNPDGSEAGWDWNIKRRILPQRDMVFVHPKVSRALHIGEFGVHMRPEMFKDSQAPSFNPED